MRSSSDPQQGQRPASIARGSLCVTTWLAGIVNDAIELPMFPLGVVLLPAMPLSLRAFEPRYLEMLHDMGAADQEQFGVVLIERGREVGGGDQRFAVGTVAQIGALRHDHDAMLVAARGGRRFVVDEWLEDAPYPRALVRFMPDLQWDEALGARRDRVEHAVLTTLVRCDAQARWLLVDQQADPIDRLWQLAAVTPVGELDQLTLLRSASVPELLDAIESANSNAAELILP